MTHNCPILSSPHFGNFMFYIGDTGIRGYERKQENYLIVVPSDGSFMMVLFYTSGKSHDKVQTET